MAQLPTIEQQALNPRLLTRRKIHYPPPFQVRDSIGIPSGTLGLDTSNLPTGDQIDVLLNDVSGADQMTQKIDSFLASFGIGSGRNEADIITPVQNRLMYNLGLITDQIRTGQSPALFQLQSLYNQALTLGNNFVQFVLNSRFTDRRASGQALNTVMPYIDGTCQYPVPLGYTATPGRFNCISWGDGTIGGVGTDGMLGSIRRAIVADGGTVSGGGVITNPPTGGTGGVSTMGFSTPMLVGIGVLVLFLMKRRGF